MTEKGGIEPGKLLDRVLSEPANTVGDVWGALVGDRVAAWRIRNAMDVVERTHRDAERRGLKLDTSKIPSRFAVAWFEHVQNTDEDSLQELFARLLSNAVAGELGESPDHRLVDVISKMSSLDATIFDILYCDKAFPNDKDWRKLPDGWEFAKGRGFTEREIALRALRAFGNEGLRSLETLEHLGLIASTVEVETKATPIRSRSLSHPNADSLRTQAMAKTSILPSFFGIALHKATRSG